MRVMILALAMLIPSGAVNPPAWPATYHQDQKLSHTAWVAQVLEQIETIRPGMTRRQLEIVFTTEGGISTVLQRTYVTRECPYFKVDVEFRIVGRPERNRDGRIAAEDGSDVITRISKPYLQRSILD